MKPMSYCEAFERQIKGGAQSHGQPALPVPDVWSPLPPEPNPSGYAEQSASRPCLISRVHQLSAHRPHPLRQSSSVINWILLCRADECARGGRSDEHGGGRLNELLTFEKTRRLHPERSLLIPPAGAGLPVYSVHPGPRIFLIPLDEFRRQSRQPYDPLIQRGEARIICLPARITIKDLL